jgi:hypothetical protein
MIGADNLLLRIGLSDDLMKISKYKGIELTTLAALNDALDALYVDLVHGTITTNEHRAIQEEIKAKLEKVPSAGQMVTVLRKHKRRVDEYHEVLYSLARWREQRLALREL